MYQRSEPVFGTASGTASLSLDQAVSARLDHDVRETRRASLVAWLNEIDFAPDLGSDIGSLAWFRGLATCTALCALTVALAPGLRPLPAREGAPVITGDALDESRAQSIAPLAWGSDTGRRMAANDLVVPLGDIPERPTIDLTASLGDGDRFAHVLERAGVARGEAARVSAMIGSATDVARIKPGTVLRITLGRRATRTQARPLDSLDFRARIDLALSLKRTPDGLVLHQLPIAVSHLPLRIEGMVGDSLYRSARAAGAPPRAVESYIRAIASKISLSRDIAGDARFDMIVEQTRAQTGEVEYGKLLYAGITRGSRKTQLLEWTIGGRTEWFEASGVGQKRPGMASPVDGARMTSGFGMRFHPILGYSRFHQGVDFGVAYGTPIHAVTDGLVTFAGRHGGNGNFVRLNHAGGIGTSYSHMSQILVGAGSRVRQGQLIGYVGSTGLSTGPHLHFEVYRDGRVINPAGVSFASTSLLSGVELSRFRLRLAQLMTVPTPRR